MFWKAGARIRFRREILNQLPRIRKIPKDYSSFDVTCENPAYPDWQN